MFNYIFFFKKAHNFSKHIWVLIRAVTVADFYHRGGNVQTTAGSTVLFIFIYI